jgi:hypothetical protein
VFVAAELDRSTAYPGQQVTLAYRLYTQANVSGLQLQENPPLSGFWVENLEVEKQPAGTRRIINGREYLEYTVKKQALFPTAPGRLRIPPSTFAISVRSSRDFFSLLGQAETIYRRTGELTLEVKPLPAAGRPQGFGNVVGDFSFSAELDKPQVAAGDAVSLRVKVAGTGNLKEIPDVRLPQMPDLTVYSSKRQEDVHPVDGDLIGGEKSWEYVIVPKAAGDHEIPPLSFSYYDPQREAYRTLTTTPLMLRVAPPAESGESASMFSGLGRQSLTRQGTDINFIKLSGDGLRAGREPLHESAWVYLLAGLPLLFNAGAFLYQRERARQSQNAAWLRSRKARRSALLRLRRAEKLVRAEPRRFYDEAAAAFAGYLEDRFNLPGISVTADNLERILKERGVKEGVVREAIDVLGECDFGRFVSASGEQGRRQALAARVRKTIVAMEAMQT